MVGIFSKQAYASNTSMATIVYVKCSSTKCVPLPIPQPIKLKSVHNFLVCHQWRQQYKKINRKKGNFQ